MANYKLPDGIFEDYFKTSPDLLCVFGLDARFALVNPAFEDTLGWSSDEILGRPCVEFVHPEDAAGTSEQIDSLATGLTETEFKTRFRAADGSYKTLHWSARRQESNGSIFASARDFSDIHKSDQRFRVALEASPVATLVVDRSHRIRYMNSQVETLFGYHRDALLDSPLDRLIPDRFRADHAEYEASYFDEPQPRPMGMGRQVLGMHENGYEFPVEIGLSPVDLEDGPHVIATLVDRTLQRRLESKLIEASEELKQANQRLTELATTDEQTGLINRRAFNDQLRRHLRLMQRMRSPLSILLLDIDGFKELNDQFGHLAGDTALSDLGAILQQVSRGSDIAARQGGDEFAIILPSTDESGALKLAERIRHAVQDHAWPWRKLTISLGVSTILLTNSEPLDDQKHPSMILSAADRALYKSKHAGGNRVSHDDPSEHPVSE